MHSETLQLCVVRQLCALSLWRFTSAGVWLNRAAQARYTIAVLLPAAENTENSYLDGECVAAASGLIDA